MKLGNLSKRAGLTIAFMLVADMAMAATTGVVGLHGFIVDAGASLGQELGIPQIDWSNLWSNQELSFIDPNLVENCLESGGHMHGNYCHIGTDGVMDITSLDENNLAPAPNAPVYTFE